jgi:hypothetical protein
MNHAIPKWQHLVTCNSCWFQQLLPPPLSFKFPLFASSKNERRLALPRAERDLRPSWDRGLYGKLEACPFYGETFEPAVGETASARNDAARAEVAGWNER